MSDLPCHLNSDVLERIFSYLSFRDLLAAELCCRKWKDVIDTRRVFQAARQEDLQEERPCAIQQAGVQQASQGSEKEHLQKAKTERQAK